MREAATVLFFNAYCAPWPNPNAYEMDTILTDPVWEFAVIKNRGSVLAYFDVLSDRIARGNRGICEEVRGEYERVMNRIRWIISYDVTQRPHVFRQYGR